MITIDGLGRMIHAVNCAYNIEMGDPAPDAPYDTLPDWHKKFLRDRVESIIEGNGPETIHEQWVDLMLSLGWVLGNTKNPTATPPTHTCLKDWRELSPEMQVKDCLAISIVKNFSREILLARHEEAVIAGSRDQAWKEMVRLGEELQG